MKNLTPVMLLVLLAQSCVAVDLKEWEENALQVDSRVIGDWEVEGEMSLTFVQIKEKGILQAFFPNLYLDKESPHQEFYSFLYVYDGTPIILFFQLSEAGKPTPFSWAILDIQSRYLMRLTKPRFVSSTISKKEFDNWISGELRLKRTWMELTRVQPGGSINSVRSAHSIDTP